MHWKGWLQRFYLDLRGIYKLQIDSAHHNGECTHSTSLNFSSPPNPVPYMQENSRLRHVDKWGHTRQQKINRSLEISLQSKKDATSKSQNASLAPSVIVTFHENFTKYIQTDPEHTHIHSCNKSPLTSVLQQGHQCCKSITHQCTTQCKLRTARWQPCQQHKVLVSEK